MMPFDKEAFHRSTKMGHTPPGSVATNPKGRPVTNFWTKSEVPCNRCEKIDTHTKLICSSCKRWWHPACEEKQLTKDDLSSGKWMCKDCSRKNSVEPPPGNGIEIDDETSRSEIFTANDKPGEPKITRWSTKIRPCGGCLIEDSNVKVICPSCSRWYHEDCGGAPTQTSAAITGFSQCKECITKDLFADSQAQGGGKDRAQGNSNETTNVDQLTAHFTGGLLRNSTQVHKEGSNKSSHKSRRSTASQNRQIELMEKELALEREEVLLAAQRKVMELERKFLRRKDQMSLADSSSASSIVTSISGKSIGPRDSIEKVIAWQDDTSKTDITSQKRKPE